MRRVTDLQQGEHDGQRVSGKVPPEAPQVAHDVNPLHEAGRHEHAGDARQAVRHLRKERAGMRNDPPDTGIAVYDAMRHEVEDGSRLALTKLQSTPPTLPSPSADLSKRMRSRAIQWCSPERRQGPAPGHIARRATRVRESGTVGKARGRLRQNRRPSVKRSPRRAGFADYRYRHSPIPARKAAGRASFHQKPGPSVAAASECPAAGTDAPGFPRGTPARLPTVQVSRAVTDPRYKEAARRPDESGGHLALRFCG